MKFTSQSLKPDLKPQNEDFFFERETQRGHFFAVLDFDQHDFANLNTTLEAKLETIVNSFVTLSRFSADLFSGFHCEGNQYFPIHACPECGRA